MSIFCTACGAELPDTVNTCWSCGAPAYRGGEAVAIATEDEPPTAAPTPSGETSTRATTTAAIPDSIRKGKSHAGKLVVLSLVGLGIVGALVNAAVNSSNNPSVGAGANSNAVLSTRTPMASPTPTPRLPPYGWTPRYRSPYYKIYYPAGWQAKITEDQGWESTPWIDNAACGILCAPKGDSDTVEGINGALIQWDQENNAPVTLGTNESRWYGGEKWLVTNYYVTLGGQSIQVKMMIAFHGQNAYVMQFVAPNGEFEDKWNRYFEPMTASFKFY